MMSRRDVLKLSLAGAAVGGAGAATPEPMLGLIMPVDPAAVPPEAAAMSEDHDTTGLR